MESNPNNYVIMIETKENVFKVLTEKLNVREAREKLEVVNIALASAEEPMRAFIYNLDALKTEGEA